MSKNIEELKKKYFKAVKSLKAASDDYNSSIMDIIIRDDRVDAAKEKLVYALGLNEFKKL